MIVEHKKWWCLYFISKFLYLIAALYIYSQFTTLGDTNRYLNGLSIGSDRWWYHSTHLMDLVAGSAASLLGDFGGNVPFIFLSFIGVYYPIKRLELTEKQLIFILSMLSVPSFGIWTSIASKEAISVFFMGLILGFIIDVIKGSANKSYFLVIFSFYLCGVFKPQYLIGISALLIFIAVSKLFNFKGSGKFILIILFLIFSLMFLYAFRYEINSLSFQMPAHFRLDAGSTRTNDIWVNDFDVFWNSPYGMFIAFVGPTISEAFSKPTHMLALLESLVILGVFIVAIIKLLMISLLTGRLNVFYLGVFLTVCIWILFVHYPFGVLNPGSAIRYRQNFYAFFVVLFYFCYIEVKDKYYLSRMK
jgi:hypothetical protein